MIELRGDEALSIFTAPRDAVLAAVELQRRCVTETERDPALPLRVGMGIDVGEVAPVQGGYRGRALNLAARLCSLAGPGEVFATEDVVRGAARIEELAYVERGRVPLKGFEEPVQVIHVLPREDLPQSFPPLLSLVARPSNLPPQTTRFVGREREIGEIAALLTRDDVRLLTMTGPGGTGKTRLAVEVGGAVLDAFERGVFFVALAPVADPALVPSTIASTLSVREVPGQDTLDTLAAFLADKQMLLVLDNFEHLLPAAGDVAALLRRCPLLTALVTSRAVLELSAEHEYPVPPLPFPDAGQATDLEALAGYSAIALFIDRARAARPGFEVTGENAGAVAEICARLDGLPLAVELAAARIRALPPERLLARLERRLPLLTTGPRDAPARQRTLRAAIEWSYELLSPEDRRTFSRLAVFAGGFDPEAAEEVCGADLDALESLLRQSLLLITEEGRFAYLQTIHELASELLEASGEAAVIKRRHAEYFLALASSANLTLEADGVQRHDLIIRERNNVRAALSWARASGDRELALRLALPLENYWVASSPREGKKRLDELLEGAEDLPVPLRALLLRASGNVRIVLGQIEEGMRFYERSLADYRRLGDERGIGIILQRLAAQEELQVRDPARARTLAEESLSLHERIGFTKGTSISWGVLADLERRAGNEASALALFERSADLARRSGNLWWLGKVLLDLADLQLGRRRYAEAGGHLREGLGLHIRMGDRQRMILALALLARMLRETFREEEAGRLWGAVEAEEARAPVGQWEKQRERYAGPVLALAGPPFERGRAHGQRLSLDGAAAAALELLRTPGGREVPVEG